MKITLFGANGKTGRLLLEQAISARHTVNALTRDKKSLQPTKNLNVFVGNATKMGKKNRRQTENL